MENSISAAKDEVRSYSISSNLEVADGSGKSNFFRCVKHKLTECQYYFKPYHAVKIRLSGKNCVEIQHHKYC